MKTRIIPIGNSQGIRIPKPLLEQAGLSGEVEIRAKDENPFFSPARPITENAHRFVLDFDVVSIINCTDLFTQEAATRIDAHWQQYGVVSDKV
jgi:hypothetical protein